MILLLALQAASPQAMPAYCHIGSVAPRSAAAMRRAGRTGLLSIGTETTDRDFSRYENWRAWLGPLGIPTARVQTGWADVERRPGVWDFGKLERMVRGMKADGVEPWFDLNYGNPRYPGGGGPGLGAVLPVAGTPGREGWRRFVRETVRHFSAGDLRVTRWQIWNEPDGGPNPAADYVAFAADTARIVKAIQPDATILVAGFTGGVFGSRADYALAVVNGFAAATKDWLAPADVRIVYHPYDPNPDNSYGAPFARLRDAAARHGYALEQGENGTNSRPQQGFALNGYPWTERSQASWALRRLLGDIHRGIRTNLFTLTDLHYAVSKNNKGLLLTGEWRPEPPFYGDQRLIRPKLAYRAVQALAAIFDDRLRPVGDTGCVAPAGHALQGWERRDGARVRRLVAVWRSSDRPGADESVRPVEIRCDRRFAFGRAGLTFTDLLPARVHAMPAPTEAAEGFAFRNVPVGDSPVLIADAGVVPVTR